MRAYLKVFRIFALYLTSIGNLNNGVCHACVDEANELKEGGKCPI